MKLLRYGPPGEEKPGILDGEGAIRDLSGHVGDITGETIGAESLARLREIDEALRRIDDRTYGVCQMTGKAIPKARLAAKPWAKYTIEAARKVEAGWGS